MDDVAELALEGVPIFTEHYDKVYDPLKEKTKQGVHKIKKMRNRRRDGGYESETESEYDERDRYEPPPRSQTDDIRRTSRDYNRRRSGRDDFVEERYGYYKGSDRAKSIGHGGRDRHQQSCTFRTNYSLTNC